jgi:arsenate reductase
MIWKVYAYKSCDTCRRAIKWLAARGVKHEVIAIREQPPTVAELRAALRELGGDLRRLFNTSGGDYKAMNLKDSLASMSEDQALALLSSNGNLVKRPFVVGEGLHLVGFKEPEWESTIRS